MILRRTLLQNIFLFIVTLCVSINASNSNFLIQLSSINFIILFFLCLKNKAGKIKKIMKKLMQFNNRKYELLGSRLKDQNSLSILIDEYKA